MIKDKLFTLILPKSGAKGLDAVHHQAGQYLVAYKTMPLLFMLMPQYKTGYIYCLKQLLYGKYF